MLFNVFLAEFILRDLQPRGIIPIIRDRSLHLDVTLRLLSLYLIHFLREFLCKKKERDLKKTWWASSYFLENAAIEMLIRYT